MLTDADTDADPHALMRRQLYCDRSLEQSKVVEAGASSASREKFQLANMISGKLATPVLGIH